jgi:phosphatidylserine decarboxylase
LNREGLAATTFLFVFALTVGFIGLYFHNLAMYILTGLTALLLVFSVYFFRDPKRTPPGDRHAIVAPADGKITDISRQDEPEYIGEDAWKISIFLSIFDVHVNYIPLAGLVDYLRYSKGKFHAAFRDKASLLNEHTLIGIRSEYGKYALKQIAGVLARRIVCNIRQDHAVQTGQKFGMIKFGSRVDLFLPGWATISVAEGDRVRAGESIIGKVNAK